MEKTKKEIEKIKVALDVVLETLIKDKKDVLPEGSVTPSITELEFWREELKKGV